MLGSVVPPRGHSTQPWARPSEIVNVEGGWETLPPLPTIGRTLPAALPTSSPSWAKKAEEEGSHLERPTPSGEGSSGRAGRCKPRVKKAKFQPQPGHKIERDAATLRISSQPWCLHQQNEGTGPADQ